MKKIFNNIEPFLNNLEKKSVIYALKKREISTYGSLSKKFEDKISKLTKYKYTIGLNSGSSGLFLSFKSLNTKKGDIIITSTYTFVATINSIIAADCKPWIFDVEKKNLGINLDQVSDQLKKRCYKRGKFLYHKTLKKRIVAICPVIFSGFNINYKRLKKLANRHNLKIVADSAGAIGSFNSNRHISRHTDINVISFNGNKLITTGGGGTVSTNNYQIYKKINSLSANCVTKKKYVHSDNGFNMKMTNIHAAVGLAQLKKKEHIFMKKKKICDTYLDKIKNEKLEIIYNKDNIPWVFPIIIKNVNLKKKIVKHFKKKNIILNDFWVPMHNQSFKQKLILNDFKNINYLKNKILLLPSDINLSISIINKIAKELNKFC